jgi:hypothetical protein
MQNSDISPNRDRILERDGALFINEWTLDRTSSPFTCGHRGCKTRIKSRQWAVFYDSDTCSLNFCLEHGLKRLRSAILALMNFAEVLENTRNKKL